MTDVVFQGIRSESLSERIRKDVIAAIRDGRLQAGQRLPAERTLAEQFGVSRVVVREAFRSLAAMGWVNIHAGRGVFVAMGPGDAFAQVWMSWLERNKDELSELLVVRRALEELAARGAARNASEDDLALLRRSHQELVVEINKGQPDFEVMNRLDIEFHHHVAVAGHGLIVQRLVDELATVLIEARQILWTLPGRPRASATDHEQIIKAIAAGDSEAAAEAMCGHMDRVIAILTGDDADKVDDGTDN